MVLAVLTKVSKLCQKLISVWRIDPVDELSFWELATNDWRELDVLELIKDARWLQVLPSGFIAGSGLSLTNSMLLDLLRNVTDCLFEVGCRDRSHDEGWKSRETGERRDLGLYLCLFIALRMNAYQYDIVVAPLMNGLQLCHCHVVLQDEWLELLFSITAELLRARGASLRHVRVIVSGQPRPRIDMAEWRLPESL